MTRWRWAAVAAAAALVSGLAFGFIPGSAACPAHPPQPAWGAFQKIGSIAEARAFLTGACPGALRLGMAFDALVFIPAYTAFLLLVARAAGASRKLWLQTVILLAAGVVADQIEGLLLWGIIDTGGGTGSGIFAVNMATLAKDLFLALATIPVGFAIGATGGWRRAAGAIAALGATVAFVAGVAGFPGVLALAVAWLTLAATAWVMALRRVA